MDCSGDSILQAKDMREGLQATVRADEVKVWGESGAKMRDMARLVEGQMGNVRKEGKKVEGICYMWVRTILGGE